MRPRRIRLACLALLGLFLGGHATSAAADTETDAEARALYEAGRIAFDQGRFDSALDYFERSYELSGRPALLFNVGSAADRLRRDEVALDAFERYLEAVPDSPDRASVEARIAVLRKALAEETQAPEAEPQEVIAPDLYEVEEPVVDYGVDPVEASEKRRTLGWVLTATGAGVAFTGFILFATGQVKRSDIENAQPGTTWSDVEGSKNANAFTASGAALSLVGLGATAAGLVFLLKKDDAPSGRAVKLSPTMGGLHLSGSF